MALAKERSIPHESSFMMSCVNNMSPQSPYSPDEFDKQPTTTNGIADQFRAANNQPDESQLSVINFSGFLANSDQPLLSFDPKEEYYGSTNSDHQSYQWPPNNNQNSRFSADFSCSFQTASDYSNCASQNGWLYSESTVTTDHSFEESGSQESAGFNKRPNVGESTQVAKKQCTSSTNSSTSKKPKVQKPCPSKDPQSIAAKNRRERISERLKVLQELVPNGSKVDLVTMLEKAIGYVKFLQLQVKVLATDEFWPVQGGKAPDISQVREAIDAILTSSQKDRNSIS